jgi:hypothetical protein
VGIGSTDEEDSDEAREVAPFVVFQPTRGRVVGCLRARVSDDSQALLPL